MSADSTADQVALVTGANKGIGREIARRLGTAGLTVYLGARSEERGRRAEQELLADRAGDIRFLPLDVTDQAQVDAAVKRIGEESGRLDVLVNNAGIAVEWGLDVEDITADHLRQAYEVNVFGPVTVTRACLPLLRRSPHARIVNLSSPLGSLNLLTDPDHVVSTRRFLAYSSSKAALNAITVVYANALWDQGIHVNAANPGLTATDLNGFAVGEHGARTPEEAADVPSRLALIGVGGPTAEFRGGSHNGSFDDPTPW